MAEVRDAERSSRASERGTTIVHIGYEYANIWSNHGPATRSNHCDNIDTRRSPDADSGPVSEHYGVLNNGRSQLTHRFYGIDTVLDNCPARGRAGGGKSPEHSTGANL